MYEEYLTPLFSNIKGRMEHINSLETKFDTFKGWYDWNYKSHRTMVELAAWYIHENWEKVDWKDFTVVIGGVTYSNNKIVAYSDDALGKLMEACDDCKTSFDRLEYTYDESDGDLSVMVYGDNIIENDDSWCFLNDQEIIDAALYLEKKRNEDKI